MVNINKSIIFKYNHKHKIKIMKEITQEEFEKLPMNEQMFRWQLFIESEGYQKNLTKKRITELKKKFKVD